MEPAPTAHDIQRAVLALPERSTQAVRAVRKRFSAALKSAPPQTVLDLAFDLIRLDENLRWVAYELVHAHKDTLHSLGLAEVKALGRGIDSWQDVDTFAPWIAGVAWRRGQIPDEAVHRWAGCADRWWRRAALVSTTALNTRARGGRGDVSRTLAVCTLLVDDPDEMVIKALSWALRELVPYNPPAVRDFLGRHADQLSPRVLREVRNKLETGLKNPGKSTP